MQEITKDIEILLISCKLIRHNSKRRKHRKVKGKQNYCRLHHYEIDFKDVGWDDYILSPPKYFMNYCAGKCIKCTQFSFS